MTKKLTFYDANSLIYRAQMHLVPKSEMPATVGPIVDSLLKDPDRDGLISDLVVLEFRNVLSRLCRDTRPECRPFDVQWVSASLTDLMASVKSGEVEIVNNRPQAANQASTLVDLATRDHGLAFGVWDTMHIIAASAIAHKRGQSVDLVTADKGFTKFIDLYPHFGRFVVPHMLVHR